jgi:hypothetical protein
MEALAMVETAQALLADHGLELVAHIGRPGESPPVPLED